VTVTRDWYLELDDVPLATLGWEVMDLSPIFDSPALRGADRVIPRVHGVRAYPRWRTARLVTLAIDVFGEADEDGVAYDDRLVGMITNLDYLKATIGLGAASDGTVSAVVYRGDMPSLTGPVHFLGFKGTAAFGDDSLRTTFDLSIPAGQFESSGS
jgi:hypothetical protein